MNFSYKSRKETIDGLKNTDLDLLIIGGGITGAGVAIQAAKAGAKVGLLEMQDFAEGTSSRSTKLVHGGIRYLKTFDVGVVSDTVKERAVVQGIAPHIPKPFPMLLPIYDTPDQTFDMFSVKIAMDLYDRLAGVEASQYANYTIDRDEVLQREPGLKSDKLLGAGVYLDYVNNDARLVIENIKGAVALGGLMASRVKAVNVSHNADGKIDGVTAQDVLSGEEFDVNAKLVINTTGPWSSKFLGLDDKNGENGQVIRPTKGVHLVVDESVLSVPQPTYSDSGAGDGRMIFVVPREGKTYFGTTDTDYTGDYTHPTVEQDDVDYLLKAINNRFPEANITLDDIEASWAGIRPLLGSNAGSDYNGGGANTGKVSDESFNNLIATVAKFNNGEVEREDVEKSISALKQSSGEKEVSASQVSRGSSLDVGEDGLITLSGGKITDYRKMAAGAMELITKTLKDKFNVEIKDIDSTKLQVSGGHFYPTNVEKTLGFYTNLAIGKGIPEDEAKDLANRFGSNMGRVVSYVDDVDVAPGLTLADTISLHYSIDSEMTLTPVDYLLRRTNFVLFHEDKLMEKKDAIIDEMARVLGWSADEKQKQTDELNDLIAETRLDSLKNK